ncbi:MAG: hypothetical protein ACREOO_21650 [bacterium]
MNWFIASVRMNGFFLVRLDCDIKNTHAIILQQHLMIARGSNHRIK